MGTGGDGRTVWCQASGLISALVSIRAARRGGEESNQVSDPFTRDPGDTGPGAWTARSETARYRVLRWGALDRDLSPLCRRTRRVRSLFRGGTSWPPATDGGRGRRQSCAGRSTASRRKCDGIEIGAARGQLVINIPAHAAFQGACPVRQKNLPHWSDAPCRLNQS